MPIAPRSLALAAGLALVCAGAGTWAYTRTPPEAALSAVKRVVAPVMQGPANLKKIKATIAEHAPSKAVVKASQAVKGAALPPASVGRAKGAAPRPGWKDRPFGRGRIMERR